MPAKPVPDGYTSVSPYIMSADPDRLISFLKEAFGGELFHVSRQGDGKIDRKSPRLNSRHVRQPRMPSSA